MPLTEINPIKAALEYMRAAKYQEAANMLRCEFDKAPHCYELGRIANMITPCGMIAEAIDALHRIDGGIEDYYAHPPADEDISQAAPLNAGTKRRTATGDASRDSGTEDAQGRPLQ